MEGSLPKFLRRDSNPFPRNGPIPRAHKQRPRAQQVSRRWGQIQQAHHQSRHAAGLAWVWFMIIVVTTAIQFIPARKWICDRAADG
jgi:hypothetical protein